MRKLILVPCAIAALSSLSAMAGSGIGHVEGGAPTVAAGGGGFIEMRSILA
jgi:hypothetical protein